MKTPLGKATEQTGYVPACTGARLKIVKIEPGKTKEGDKRGSGLRLYAVQLAVIEPKQFKGMRLFDRIVVGTEDDPKAKKDETWESEQAGRLLRLLRRSGTPISDDDEEWMEAAVDNEVVAPIKLSDTANGTFNNVGLYYSPSDDDAPAIGVADPAKGGGGKGKGAAAASKAARAKAKAAVEDEDDESEDEVEDDEAPKKKAKKAPAEEDEEEDEEDTPPKKAKPGPKKKGKPAKDEDDDDDDEDDDD